jgi:hypothetical protein
MQAAPIRALRLIPFLALLSLASSGCYYPAAWVALPIAVASTAIVTAAIISASAPPPPRVVYVPVSRPGYAWQPGYWVLDGGRWVWVDGRWVSIPPGYAWSPTHWQQRPDGDWQLVPGTLVPAQPYYY